MGKTTGAGRARLLTLREANGLGKEAAKVFLDLEVKVEVEVETLVVPCVNQEGILYTRNIPSKTTTCLLGFIDD